MSSGLSLRFVDDSDCCLLWKWANDVEVRQQSFNSEPISWTSHVNWFVGKLNDPDCHYFIGLNEGGLPIGQVRFDVTNYVEVSVSVASSERGKGHGSSLLRMASTEMFRTVDIIRIDAHIRPENVASQQAFLKAGYLFAGRVLIKGQEAMKMNLFREQGDSLST